jgi:hypothetical protein
LRDRDPFDDGNFVWVNLYPFLGYGMAKDSPCIHKKFTFLRDSDERFISMHFFQDFAQIRESFMEVTSIRSEIIHVYLNRVMNKFNKNTQNFPLESSRGIAQTKWKNSIGKGTPRTCECGLILVFRADLDLVVSTKSIQEGE